MWLSKTTPAKALCGCTRTRGNLRRWSSSRRRRHTTANWGWGSCARSQTTTRTIAPNCLHALVRLWTSITSSFALTAHRQTVRTSTSSRPACEIGSMAGYGPTAMSERIAASIRSEEKTLSTATNEEITMMQDRLSNGTRIRLGLEAPADLFNKSLFRLAPQT